MVEASFGGCVGLGDLAVGLAESLHVGKLVFAESSVTVNFTEDTGVGGLEVARLQAQHVDLTGAVGRSVRSKGDPFVAGPVILSTDRLDPASTGQVQELVLRNSDIVSRSFVGVCSVQSLDLAGSKFHWTNGIDALVALSRLFPSVVSLSLSRTVADSCSLQHIGGFDYLSSLNVAGLRGLDGRSLIDVPSFFSNNTHLHLTGNVHSSTGSFFSCYSIVGTNRRGDEVAIQIDDADLRYSFCFCDPDYFGRPPNCTSCSQWTTKRQATCPPSRPLNVNGTTLEEWTHWRQHSGIVVPARGYWMSPGITAAERDRLLERHQLEFQIVRCVNWNAADSPCAASADDLDQRCLPGYEGRKCSRCSDEHFSLGPAKCLACPSSMVVRTVIAGVEVVAVAVVVVWAFYAAGRASGLSKVLVNFLQCASVVSRLPSDLVMPQRGAGAAISLSPVGVECWFRGFGVEHAYVMGVLTPPVLIVLVGLIHAVGWLVRGADSRSDWRRSCSQALVFLLYSAYFFTSQWVLIPLQCEQDPVDLRSYWMSYPHLCCSPAYSSVSWALLALYVVLPPLLCAVSILRKRHLEALSLLVSSYRPGFALWEMAVMMRRFLIVLALVVVPDSSIFRGFLVACTLALSLVTHMAAMPYSDTKQNWAEAVGLVMLIVNHVAALETQLQEFGDARVAQLLVFFVNVVFVCVVGGLVVVHSSLWRRLDALFRRRSPSRSGREWDSLLLDRHDTKELVAKE